MSMLADQANAPQAIASDPGHSAWVTANAGSGKTKVLIDRVARLLLGRAEDRDREPDPSKILCLTYTRAAAANMQNQLFKRLGGWALLDDDALRIELEKLAPNRADTVDLQRARRLFAQALETPGGLKIQTIHAFCESLLRRFPLEAKVSPHFSLLDEIETAKITREASDRAITRALQGGNSALRDAAMRVMDRVQEGGIAPMVMEITRQRTLYVDDLPVINARINETLDVDEGDTSAGYLSAYDDEVPWAAIRKLAWVYAEHGGAHEKKVAPALFDAIDDGDAEERLAATRAAFLTGKGEPRKIGKGFPTKAVLTENPDAATLIAEEQDRLMALADRLHAIEIAAQSRALARFAKAVLGEITQLKSMRDAVDFDDLIRMASELLRDSEARDWVRYKLDGGVDHILVDEAQDTSAEQWSVIAAIAEEFFAGEGAIDVHRTLFVVGDEKQSIYSFQGAAPEELARMRERFAALTQNTMLEPKLLHSFRSAPAVLNAVDAVFADEAARNGLSALNDPPQHVAFRENRPGRVEYWPPAGPRDEPESQPWWQPVDMVPPQAPHLRLAEAIADRIQGWIGKVDLPSRGRKIKAGDILILVRRRNAFTDAMIRALKARDLAVAGEDRMVLTGQLAVKDLLALASFALLPEDDLTCATVLRSPIVNLSEEALFSLANNRKGRLWHNLVRRRDEYPEAHAILADMLGQADFMRPYEFFEHLLSHHGARARLLGRLGVQAEDPIDEFLAQALAFETVETPTLQAFVERLVGADFQVKREMEQGRDEIRVMTAHGAKGLEANIVFLPDTAALPPNRSVGLFDLDGAPVWSRVKGEDPAAVRESRDVQRIREMQEYRRLLYVGMTRAQDWLVVCGYHGRNSPNAESWVNLVQNGFDEAQECETPLKDADGNPVTGLMIESTGNEVDIEDEAPSVADTPVAPDASLMELAATEQPAPVALSPSRLTDTDPTDPWPLPSEGEEAEEPVSSAERGTLMHQMLEKLASIAPENRRSVAASAPEQIEAQEAVLAILENSEFSWIFAEGSLAEVPIAGSVQALGGRSVSGYIDRLVVSDTTVDVIDFKSGRPPADGSVPEAYLRQLAVYNAVMSEIYPDHAVSAHLLWLDAGYLDTVDAAELAAALERTRTDVLRKANS